MVRQYQPPRIPDNWGGQEKRFAQEIIDALDDITRQTDKLKKSLTFFQRADVAAFIQKLMEENEDVQG